MKTNFIVGSPNPSEVDAMVELHRAGWSVAEMGTVDGDGEPRWTVRGSNGDRRIRSEGSSPAEAWGHALDQARSGGTLDRPRTAEPGCARSS